jgi:hypothetical protein
MYQRMTGGAHQVLFGIIAAMAAKLFVVNLEI